MRKIIFLITLQLLALSCKQPNREVLNEDMAPISIERTCKDFEEQELSPEEAVEWDSMNVNGGYMLVRNAERNLDTIVNHIHLVFITEP